MKNFKTVLYGLNYIRFYYFCSNKSRKSKLERVSKVMKISPYSYKQWADFLNISERDVRKIIHKQYFLTCHNFITIAEKTNTPILYLFQGEKKK